MQTYLDHNATTPLHPEVLAKMLPHLTTHFGNASSTHETGRTARRAVEEARGEVALLIGCEPEEIVFTGSGTEADNLALRGVAGALAGRGAHLVTSAIEHHAVLNCARDLGEKGCRISFAGVDRDCAVDTEEVLSFVGEGTILVSVMHANNETGALQPIERIGAACRERGVLFHTDAVQTAGKVPIDVKRLAVDLLSLSAHKIRGPKGVGALFVKKGTPLRPILFGGVQEEGLRAGTYNTAGIVGFGAAARLARLSLGEQATYLGALRERLERGLARIAPEAVFLVPPARRLSHTLTVCFPCEDNRSIVTHLDLAGIAVSSGAACNSASEASSHVLAAMGVEPSLAAGSVRFSLGAGNTEADLDCVLAALKGVLARRRGAGLVASTLRLLKKAGERA